MYKNGLREATHKTVLFLVADHLEGVGVKPPCTTKKESHKKISLFSADQYRSTENVMNNFAFNNNNLYLKILIPKIKFEKKSVLSIHFRPFPSD